MEPFQVAGYLEREFIIKKYNPIYWVVDKFGYIYIEFKNGTKEKFRVGINNRWEWFSGTEWVGKDEYKGPT